jgi:hypothetical protein
MIDARAHFWDPERSHCERRRGPAVLSDNAVRFDGLTA